MFIIFCFQSLVNQNIYILILSSYTLQKQNKPPFFERIVSFLNGSTPFFDTSFFPSPKSAPSKRKNGFLCVPQNKKNTPNPIADAGCFFLIVFVGERERHKSRIPLCATPNYGFVNFACWIASVGQTSLQAPQRMQSTLFGFFQTAISSLHAL